MRRLLLLGLVAVSQGCHFRTVIRTDDNHFIMASNRGGTIHHPECPGCHRSRTACGRLINRPAVQQSVEGWRERMRHLYEQQFGTTDGFENGPAT